MTDKEALNVKVGDVLMTKIGKVVVPVVVDSIVRYEKWVSVGTTVTARRFRVYRKGKPRVDRFDNPLPTLERLPAFVRLAAETEAGKDPLQANVYADWLDENGFADAAQALRKAFPVGTPEEQP